MLGRPSFVIAERVPPLTAWRGAARLVGKYFRRAPEATRLDVTVSWAADIVVEDRAQIAKAAFVCGPIRRCPQD